ncbi:phospho-sugar mutase [Saccharopolyspora rectivirgula]|uniref:Phosphomannomutase n=1 Tax=Saccharopolyspora rectivirgula TaxID=28042 RepID=A0A073BEI6_9PSEU|nr:phospho-sugar mutase [Saccharopolyspora rectivirgula]KEI46134.1 phosphomannomutase [Saccharopolyspora rectivirgula]
MTADAQLIEATKRWIADDLDPAAQAELEELLAAAGESAEAAADLADRMSGMPRFGTAGIRGQVRAGANGMNRAVVVRTTAGVAAWLAERGFAGGTVVVGRDARHGSEAFATDTADVLAAAGFEVRVLPEPLPTPVLAYAVRALDAVAGVQITASHNPPQDNGYKLYLRGGVQLISPADSEIEAAIAATPPARSVPRERSWTLLESALPDYLRQVAALPRGGARPLRIAATALHGVGARTLRQALEMAGFPDVRFVASQVDPDPDFPTVSFPNPEEPGATDALLELAEQEEADLAIALDPDADRCALGIREDGRWRMLRGDETGVLLAHHVLSAPREDAPEDPLVATTIVSSTMLSAMAADFGVRHAATPTGFKWLMRAGDGAGTGLVYAYEEALGHCVAPDLVRDKDGISTAVLACDLAAGLKEAGRGLDDLLDELFTAYGVHRTGQVSVRVTDLSIISRTMQRLRENPPTRLGGVAVRTRDLRPDFDALLITGPAGLRVVIRPSGTEPKLKCYLEVVEQVAEDGLPAAKERATVRLAELQQAVSALVQEG